MRQRKDRGVQMFQRLLNFQNRNGFIKPYQARELILMIDNYGDEQT